MVNNTQSEEDPSSDTENCENQGDDTLDNTTDGEDIAEARSIYDNEYSEDINKVTWDHFNIPQLVFCFMINEFIIEDVKYSFEAFAKLWYELAKTHGVLKTQNKDLSCKDKPVMVNQRFDTRYIDEGIEVMDSTYNKINSRSSFPKFLLGSKVNRKYTWMPWGRAGSGSWYGLWNEEGHMIGNWGE